MDLFLISRIQLHSAHPKLAFPDLKALYFLIITVPSRTRFGNTFAPEDRSMWSDLATSAAPASAQIGWKPGVQAPPLGKGLARWAGR